jgi:glycosyltransferase involved in cell wall biosynthesis
MRCELVSQFGVRPEAISVIPFGINNAVPRTPLTPAEAKQKLQVDGSERAVLFFGRIQPYKGMQYLVEALESLVLEGGARYRLIVAGQPKKEHVRYWSRLQARIANGPLSGCVLQRIEYIPDGEVEMYFKAADVLVLPYTDIYESGVLYLSYSFGLPVIATDVGSFRDEIVHGETGLICRCSDSSHLARTIEEYFASPLYARLDGRRQGIQEYAHTRHSWDTVADLTVRAYRGLLTAQP